MHWGWKMVRFAKTLFMRQLVLAFLLLPLLSLSQTGNDNVLQVSYQEVTAEWVQFHSQDGVLFYAKKADCNRPSDGIYQEMILLKIVNTTDYNLTISWDLLQWLDGQLWTRLPIKPENQRRVNLEGSGMLEGSCDNFSDYYTSLAVFCRFLNYSDKPELTKFEFANINISRYEN